MPTLLTRSGNVIKDGNVNSDNVDFSMTSVEMSGADFRERRKRLGLSQARTAEIMGCTRQHIWSIEDRIAVPNAYALAILQIEAMKSNEAA